MTDGGDCNIPDAFFKKRGDTKRTISRSDLLTQPKRSRVFVYSKCYLACRSTLVPLYFDKQHDDF